MSANRRLGSMKWALAAGVLCAYWACQEEKTRPGGIGDCGEDCTGGPNPIVRPSVNTSGTGGSAGAGGSAGGGNAGSAGSSSMSDTLSGTIQALSATLTGDSNLNGTVRVQAAGVDTDQVSVNADPSGDFQLDGVNASLPLWVGVGPFTSAPDSTFVDTLQKVESPLNVPVELRVLRRSALEEILTTGFLGSTELDPARGHVLLRFVDDQRQGIAGARLVSPDPATVSVAYDREAIYSNQETETDLRGIIILLNLTSTPYPGTASTIGVNVLGTRRDIDVRVANGAMTLVTTVVAR